MEKIKVIFATIVALSPAIATYRVAGGTGVLIFLGSYVVVFGVLGFYWLFEWSLVAVGEALGASREALTKENGDGRSVLIFWKR